MSRLPFGTAVGLGLACVAAGSLSLHAAVVNTHGVPPGSTLRATEVRQTSSVPAAGRALLDSYCVTCHNQQLQTAGLMLDTMDLMELERVGSAADAWEKVVRKLRGGTMPPPGSPRPPQAAYAEVASWLEAALDRAAAARPNPGRVPALHRLNRSEYTSVIRDLLALDIDAPALLPTDESVYGFDNIADALTLSPALLERYMLAASKISRLAVGVPATRPGTETYRVPMPLVQEERMSEDLPFGSRGGTAIRHYFPADGEYILRLRLHRTWTDSKIRGLRNREQIDVRLDGVRLTVFAVGGDCVGSSAPECKRPVGIIAASTYEKTADAGLEIRVPVQAGPHVLGISFPSRGAPAPEGAGQVRNAARHSSFSYNANADMAIERVEIEGPFEVTGPGDTPSRRRIFVCRPTDVSNEESCATEILTTLARRAHRRPATQRDIETLSSFYRAGHEQGGFEAGIQVALERLLVSPEFLFRVERSPAPVAPGAIYRISDLELASRLSFFLWSSMPDDELLDLAAAGTLDDPTVLEQQVRRMLADDRAAALMRNFGGQWLYLRNMAMVAPDPETFPEFDDNLRHAFQRETELFLESQLRDDRPVADLLTADYTFVNERLARHYGIPHVYGSHFRRVGLGDDNRAGLLGQGSILTVTSYSTRTSPVVRGKWLLENLLGAPPPPPPATVPALPENAEDGQPPTSVRARLERHRRNPVCASCHSRMDPLGFALENFNAIGQWRTTEANASIDATGILPDGTAFAGPAEFRIALLSHHTEFGSTVVERLFTYALGRNVEYYDMPAIRTIMREAAPTDYRWSALILGIVKSLPFQMRTAAGPRAGDSGPADARRQQ